MVDGNYKLFYKEIVKIIPSRRIYTDPLRLFAYGTDASFYRMVPKLVLQARDEEEIEAIIRLSTQYKLPITFRAAGTALSGQAITDSILVITGKEWEQYTILEEGQKIRVQPGIVGARINEHLKPYGRKLGPDPASVRSAMIGGIVANNASGMNGTDENSYKTIESIRLILADGTLLDTGSEESKENFRQTHPQFLENIRRIKQKIESTPEIRERILKKYRIKNTTGIGMNSFTDFEDPFDIITHLLVGSEGTLAFIASVTLNTLEVTPCKASAMLYHANIVEACRTVQLLKQTPAGSVELLDRLSLKSIENDEGIPAFIKNLPSGATALLVETRAKNEEELQKNIRQITETLQQVSLLHPLSFTDKLEEYSKYWQIRSGVFPAVGAMRKPGTSCLIEDVVFPLEVLPEATAALQKLIARFGYEDGVIYGHAIEGNFHFIINEDFSQPERVAHFGQFLKETARLVVEKYDGSLKGEHGTGRNIAPYVAYEWGNDIFGLMKEVKQLFDPENILNRDVIFNSDPGCNLKHLKSMSLTNPHVDRCIECGFCEVNCLTCGFTLSARQRITVQREISRLHNTGDNPGRLKALRKGYKYYGEVTCAKDGLCAISCPVHINTGELTRDIREAQASPLSKSIAHWTAVHFGTVTKTVRFGLKTVHFFQHVLGNKAFGAIAGSARWLSGNRIPLWTPAMPRGINKPAPSAPKSKITPKVVYFPSCINQVMGAASTDLSQQSLHQVTEQLFRKAGYEVIYPENMGHLCCGTIWESKGFAAEADRKSEELEKALLKASGNGKYPVVCDQSPCLYRMKKVMKSGLSLYEPAEFIVRYLMDRLDFHPVEETVSLHITCSMTKMEKSAYLVRLAQACCKQVFIPEEVGCCGFAGDRGFTHPEVNAYALRKLKDQIKKVGASSGYSNSRTCEIGLTTNSGIPYSSIVYLVDRCTTPKK